MSSRLFSGAGLQDVEHGERLCSAGGAHLVGGEAVCRGLRRRLSRGRGAHQDNQVRLVLQRGPVQLCRRCCHLAAGRAAGIVDGAAIAVVRDQVDCAGET